MEDAQGPFDLLRVLCVFLKLPRRVPEPSAEVHASIESLRSHRLIHVRLDDLGLVYAEKSGVFEACAED